MKVTLLQHTPNPDETVALAARICYAPGDIAELTQSVMSPARRREFLNMLIKRGHHTPLEHITFTFGVEGVSRACSHQLVRHRIASFCQQSQRYVEMHDAAHDTFVVPPGIAADPEAEKLYRELMRSARETYAALRARGVAREDARYVLPSATETALVVTMNARSLLNLFALRLCRRAQWEVRTVAEQMLALARQVSPEIFAAAGPGCVTGACPEGKNGCGQPYAAPVPAAAAV
ncbi:MAG TPA: FAD-dependent thymidylate synthase [bacterium]|nr:FAD-dependent thymidylate synthase [bacterium]